MIPPPPFSAVSFKQGQVPSCICLGPVPNYPETAEFLSEIIPPPEYAPKAHWPCGPNSGGGIKEHLFGLRSSALLKEVVG